MTSETANLLLDHHKVCGGFEFTRSTLQRDEVSGARYYRYSCQKCGGGFREYTPESGSEPLQSKEAA